VLSECGEAVVSGRDLGAAVVQDLVELSIAVGGAPPEGRV